MREWLTELPLDDRRIIGRDMAKAPFGWPLGLPAGAAKIEGGRLVTTKKNPHVGSTFESWLDEQGIREEVTAGAIKEVIAEQLAAEMKKKGITKARMAEMMQTSRAQIDRLLDPNNSSATLETLMRAAKVVGRRLRLELV